ncbi:MAG TPA: glycosyltransferase family 2 protein [Chitinophagaceae bacterium]|nr:glycosyltransferase family 2 protein [Chitinophagaceae bacterium]
MDSSSVYIIIPSFNEAEVIRQTVEEVLGAGFKIILVDDCSTDLTKEKLKDLPVIYIRHKINLGQGAALQTGIQMARLNGAEIFVSFDADGQHDVNDIAAMCEKLEKENLDIVLGSRFLPASTTNISSSRKLFLKLASLINFTFTGILLTDAHNGLRAFNRHAAEKINLMENRMAHATEFLVQIKKHRLMFAEHPVHIRYTDYSRKKGQSLLNGIRIFFELILNKFFNK